MLNQPKVKEFAVNASDLICFSHLRWNFVYQRPQHLMSRFNKYVRVFYIEEPIFYDGIDTLSININADKVYVVQPMLNDKDQDVTAVVSRQKILISKLLVDKNISRYICWYYTPMALKISSHLKPSMIVYDCMDELSAFKFAPAELKLMEAELFTKADIVFTGGYSLYKSKKSAHHNIFPFPSSIEKEHFTKARNASANPPDQSKITGKKIGFYGVIDERFNIKLVAEVAVQKPDWNLILIGPVVKIDPAELPHLSNIHYLGSKAYKELPDYLAGWDIAIIPFEKNESTRFISPTKTPEYLAAGKPVISTSITDVVTPYGDENLVYIADNAADFIEAATREFNKTAVEYTRWLGEVDKFLSEVSWDNCVQNMIGQMNATAMSKQDSSVTNKQFKSVA